jgi:DNA-binding MarR family transcriptional regulator
MADDQARTDAIRSLEHELMVTVRRIKRSIGTRARMVHPELPAASWSILAGLHDHGAQRSSELADQFSIDKGAVSRQIAILEDIGLISREPDPIDGRAQLVRITADGTRRVEEVVAQRREWYERRLATWDAGELAQLASLLGSYNDALERE